MWILGQTALSAGSIGSLFTPLYFAPLASRSKSGSFSSHTFKVSTKTSGQTWRYASIKALLMAMEADLRPRGEDSMLRRRMILYLVRGNGLNRHPPDPGQR